MDPIYLAWRLQGSLKFYQADGSHFPVPLFIYAELCFWFVFDEYYILVHKEGWKDPSRESEQLQN